LFLSDCNETSQEWSLGFEDVHSRLKIIITSPYSKHNNNNNNNDNNIIIIKIQIIINGVKTISLQTLLEKHI
jgi:hypothetical protein